MIMIVKSLPGVTYSSPTAIITAAAAVADTHLNFPLNKKAEPSWFQLLRLHSFGALFSP
ncbi:hypothetical protein [Scopulibacillus darangshiensis]|uniref:hypothetical protein n=1 Tax=Scopulibacillus darangshiensis TaxID=442528 RepID=UPI001404AEA5|nr:hypothetical protein [Scopulibacillus darangshiensis]